MSDNNVAAAYLTIPQVAEVLSCSPDTVRRLIARGEIRAVRFGRLIRVAIGELTRAGRPVSALTRVSAMSEPTPQERKPSGRRADETWRQWSARSAAG